MDDTKKYTTEEDVNLLKFYINSGSGHVQAFEMIERMWLEIQSLRGALERQLY